MLFRFHYFCSIAAAPLKFSAARKTHLFNGQQNCPFVRIYFLFVRPGDIERRTYGCTIINHTMVPSNQNVGRTPLFPCTAAGLKQRGDWPFWSKKTIKLLKPFSENEKCPPHTYLFPRISVSSDFPGFLVFVDFIWHEFTENWRKFTCIIGDLFSRPKSYTIDLLQFDLFIGGSKIWCCERPDAIAFTGSGISSYLLNSSPSLVSKI